MNAPDGKVLNSTTYKVIADIDLRFQSGNDVPVERAYVRREEWTLIRGLIARLRECGEE